MTILEDIFQKTGNATNRTLPSRRFVAELAAEVAKAKLLSQLFFALAPEASGALTWHGVATSVAAPTASNSGDFCNFSTVLALSTDTHLVSPCVSNFTVPAKKTRTRCA